MMTRLDLQLATTERGAIELMAVAFKHPCLPKPQKSLRARTALAVLQVGTFTWSAAVTAFSMLALRHSAGRSNGEIAQLVGGRGSAASSLDCALTKRPLWLLDMFGVESSGVCLSQRLFWRMNTECKRPGPVRVGINPSVLSMAEVHVCLNNELIIEAEQCLRLACDLKRVHWNNDADVLDGKRDSGIAAHTIFAEGALL